MVVALEVIHVDGEVGRTEGTAHLGKRYKKL